MILITVFFRWNLTHRVTFVDRLQVLTTTPWMILVLAANVHLKIRATPLLSPFKTARNGIPAFEWVPRGPTILSSAPSPLNLIF